MRACAVRGFQWTCVAEKGSVNQRTDRGDGTDALIERLARVYRVFPPDEYLLARLSLLHQRHEGEGGVREFCAATVYAVATEVTAEGQIDLSS